MFTEKFLEALKYEGAVGITSWGAGQEPHATGTWISYLHLTEDGRLLAPAGGMVHLEADIAVNNKVLALLAVREVEGFNGYHGIAFRLTATGRLFGAEEGVEYELMKKKHPWIRGVLELKPEKLEQLL
jgi:hypothetical protein